MRLAISIPLVCTLFLLAPIGRAQTAVQEIVVPAHTEVLVEIRDHLSSETSHRGDSFNITLAEPLTISGQVVVQPGAIGVGEVIDARPHGDAGRPGVLVLALRSLRINGAQVAIRRSLALGGMSNVRSFPFIFPDNRQSGGVSDVAPGTTVSAVLAEDVHAPAIAASEAPTSRVAHLEAMNAYAEIGPPTEGAAQIVFFRPARNTAAVYAYTVRENNADIATLRNGAYVVVVAMPGLHEYGVGGSFFGGRPRETLRLEAEPGETYFVEHGISFLAPSNYRAFETRGHPLF